MILFQVACTYERDVDARTGLAGVLRDRGARHSTGLASSLSASGSNESVSNIQNTAAHFQENLTLPHIQGSMYLNFVVLKI